MVPLVTEEGEYKPSGEEKELTARRFLEDEGPIVSCADSLTVLHKLLVLFFLGISVAMIVVSVH